MQLRDVTLVICRTYLVGLPFTPKREFVGARREQRVEMMLPVRLWGMDRHGKLFEQHATTLDITPVGACLTGVTCDLQVGCIIGVQHGKSKSRFKVAWIGEPGSSRDTQIGIITVEPGKYIWGVALARQFGDFFRSEAADLPAEVPAPRISFNPSVNSHSSASVDHSVRHRSVKRSK